MEVRPRALTTREFFGVLMEVGMGPAELARVMQEKGDIPPDVVIAVLHEMNIDPDSIPPLQAIEFVAEVLALTLGREDEGNSGLQPGSP